MAREAYRSLYGDPTKLKDDSVLKDPAAGSDDADELFELLLAVSDWVDRYCNRHFYPRVETLLFDGTGGERLLVPDLISVSKIAESDAHGSEFGKAWDAGSYRLLPHNAAPLRPWGQPYGAILRVSKGGMETARGGSITPGEANFRVAGVWGYRMFAELAGATLAAPVAATASAITVSDGSQFRAGQTVLLGGDGDPASTEQALVTAIDSNELSVSRGLNGSAAADHASGGEVRILRWPASVERAALIQTARIWTRAADFEPFYVDADVDTDVRLLLEPYRKPPG